MHPTRLFLCLFILICGILPAQHTLQDSLAIRGFFDMALENGRAYEDLRSLCKDIGARLTGSAEAEMAVVWGERLLQGYGIETRLQETPIPHWERGTKEVAYYERGDGKIHRIKLLALGSSVGTEGSMRGELKSHAYATHDVKAVS